MSGNRFFLDTNAIIQLLAGNHALIELLMEADYVATSVICELEFHSFPKLSDDDKALFRQFRKQIQIIDLSASDEHLKEQIYAIRSEKKLKLPDSIIIASAMVRDCKLITADAKLLEVPGVNAESYPVKNNT